MHVIFLALWVGISVAPDTLPIAILQNGTVTATAVGEATVVATSDGVTATRTITVLPLPADPIIATVDVIIHRTIDGAGSTLVSTAMPLPIGRLTQNSVHAFRLIVNGTEIPMFVEPLLGKHADGSYRSVLIQFPMELTAGQDVVGQLQFGPTGTRITTKVPITWTLEEGIILPSSLAYIAATNVLPPTVPSAELPATALTLAFDQIQHTWMHIHMNRLDTTSGWWARETNFYDAVFAMYARWVRTGDIEAWRYATRLARLYTRAQPSQSWLFNPDGLYVNYLLTGDERPRNFLITWTGNATWWSKPEHNKVWADGSHREGREQQRVMLATLYAGMLEHWPTHYLPMADGFVQAWVDTQEPYFAMQIDSISGVDGAWHYPLGSGFNGQSNFMEGLRVSAMITYLELRQPPTATRIAVEQSIRRQVDYLWNTQWYAAASSFNYHSSEYRNTPFPPTPTQGQIDVRTVNNLMVLGFAYTYYVTGDNVYYDRALQVMSPAFLSPNWSPWWSGNIGKEFNQNYYSSWRAFYYLNNVRGTP